MEAEIFYCSIQFHLSSYNKIRISNCVLCMYLLFSISEQCCVLADGSGKFPGFPIIFKVLYWSSAYLANYTSKNKHFKLKNVHYLLA